MREQAQRDVGRVQAGLTKSSQQRITPDTLRIVAEAARARLEVVGSGYRRAHVRALVRRVDVGDAKVWILGLKGRRLERLPVSGDGRLSYPSPTL